MRTRLATVEDAPLLARMNAFVHDLHVEHEPDRYRPTDREEVEAWFRRRLQDPAQRFIIAEDDGQPVGFVSAELARRPRHPFCHAQELVMVDQVAVDPAARLRGCGRLLMDAVHDLARAEGLPRVQLEVRTFNADAIAFYEALGYREVQRKLSFDV